MPGSFLPSFEFRQKIIIDNLTTTGKNKPPMPILQRNLKWMIFLLIFIATLSASTHAEETKPSNPQALNRFLNNTLQWRRIQQQQQQEKENSQGSRLKLATPVILAGVFCFVASSFSSAGGIGGGGLFIPILTIVAGLDLKTASSFSAFMVTGGSIPNVVSNMFFTSRKNGDRTLIDYDIALLSEPCMLLGVSIGVLCNLMFPEWLITIMFAVFLAWSTFKTFGAGIFHWKMESELMSRNGCQKLENGTNDENEVLKEPLLHRETKFKLDIPWTKLGVLTMIWFSFLFLYLLRGNRYGRGIIPIEACGIGYWIISATQIPLTIIFTSWILYRRESLHNQQIQSEVAGENKSQGPVKLIFPVMAFLAGSLGGVFGVGGGMLISPLLLQVGITPQVTAATCSFMVFFSSTMSAIQYVLLGMDNIAGAMDFSIICFSGSVIGLVILQAAIEKRGRASLIVFSVGLVLALSTVLMTSFGAVDVWRDYINGRYMGFKQPC